MIDFHRFFPIEVDLVISFSQKKKKKEKKKNKEKEREREREIQTDKSIERFEKEMYANLGFRQVRF